MFSIYSRFNAFGLVAFEYDRNKAGNAKGPKWNESRMLQKHDFVRLPVARIIFYAPADLFAWGGASLVIQMSWSSIAIEMF